MARRRTTNSLLRQMDDFASRLIARAQASSVVNKASGEEGGESGQPPVEAEIAEQVSVFTAVTRWVQTKHKIDPDDEPNSGFEQLQRKLNKPNGRAPRNRRDSPQDTGGSVSDTPTVGEA